MKRWNRAIRCLPAPPRWEERRGEESRRSSSSASRVSYRRLHRCTYVAARRCTHVCTWDTNQPTLHLPSPTRQSRSAYWLRGRTLANLSVGRKQHASVPVRDNGRAGNPDFGAINEQRRDLHGLIRLYTTLYFFSFAFLFRSFGTACSEFPSPNRSPRFAPFAHSDRRSQFSSLESKKSQRRRANYFRDDCLFSFHFTARRFPSSFSQPILLLLLLSPRPLLSINYRVVFKYRPSLSLSLCSIND